MDRLIRLALAEDIGTGDITSALVVPVDAETRATVIAKEEGILCGMPAVEQTYRILSHRVSVHPRIKEGERISAGDTIAVVEGVSRAVLGGERVALNLLCRAGGIATGTARFVDRIRGTGCRLLDTRKTSPGMRALEKYAVSVGGGSNHRMGLWDMVLIKENHIASAGGIEAALDRAMADKTPDAKVEIEVRNLDELAAVLEYPVDRVMLDNFDVETIRRALESRAESGSIVPFEASGGITLENCRRFAETGIEFISSGSITHSPKGLDISMVFAEVA